MIPSGELSLWTHKLTQRVLYYTMIVSITISAASWLLLVLFLSVRLVYFSSKNSVIITAVPVRKKNYAALLLGHFMGTLGSL